MILHSISSVTNKQKQWPEGDSTPWRLTLTYTLSPFVFDDMMVTAALVVLLGSAGKLMTSPGQYIY